MMVACSCSVVSFFPLTNATHWVFRIFDFIRLQLLVVLAALLVAGYFIQATSIVFYAATVVLLCAAVAYHLFTVLPYFPKNFQQTKPSNHSICVLSVNVKQENRAYDKLLRTVQAVKPDILLTMETDKQWERGLSALEGSFKHVVRVPKSNRYGMHLYTNLEVQKVQVHYLISAEHPSIEAVLQDPAKRTFVFWGIHPPPPSPTEKPTARQKDAELAKVAKLALEAAFPVVVSGDFNNVCWSKASKLFSRISGLADARVNKGFYGTFPASFWLLRFPIDLFFHSSSVVVSKLQVLRGIGSDHLPFMATFHITPQPEPDAGLDEELETISDELIKKGKKAAKVEN